MPPLARRTRVILALAALVAALVAWQGAAVGATIHDATLADAGTAAGGATSTSSPGGSVLPATVTAKVLPGETWNRTRVDFRNVASNVVTTRCIDTGSRGSGLSKASFNVTVPGPPGDYDVTFIAVSGDSNSCSNPISPESPATLRQGLNVTAPAANPDLPARCGVNVMLILDSSGSIGDDAKHVTDAARAFLVALQGTGSQVAIVDFDATASNPPAVPYTLVTPASVADTGPFGKYLKSYDPGGTTNWEDAFKRAVEANAMSGGPVADLVFFITDGDPNTINKAGGGTEYLTPDGNVEVMRRSVTQADLVKKPAGPNPTARDSHVFALGVGAAVSNPQSEARLTAMSGSQKYPEVAFGKADYGIVTNMADLPAALREFATQMCKGSVTITKLVDEGNGKPVPDQGWTFKGNLTKPDSYKWVAPEPPPNTGLVQATTDKDGIAAFQWKPTDPTAISTFTASERSMTATSSSAPSAPSTTSAWRRAGSPAGPHPGRSRPATSAPTSTPSARWSTRSCRGRSRSRSRPRPPALRRSASRGRARWAPSRSSTTARADRPRAPSPGSRRATTA